MERELGDVVAEEAVDPVANDLRQATDPPGEDRRTAGEGLDRRQAERLRPRARHQRGVALGEQLVALRSCNLAKELDRRARGFERRQEDLLIIVVLDARRRDLCRDPQRPPRQRGDLHRLDDPLLAGDATDETQGVGATPLERRSRQRQAVVDHGPIDLGMWRRLRLADGYEMGRRRRGEELSRPWQVEPPVERRGHRHVSRPGKQEAHPFEVCVNDVELILSVQNGLGRGQEIAHRVVLEVRRSQRNGNRGHVIAGHLRVTRSERRDLVAAPNQLDDELVHDSLGAAIPLGRNTFERRGDLGNAKRPVHRHHPVSADSRPIELSR